MTTRLALLLVPPLCGAGSSAADAPDLVAPVYPDATEFAFQSDTLSIAADPRLAPIERLRKPRVQASYSRDDPETARTWYEQQLGAFEEGTLAGETEPHRTFRYRVPADGAPTGVELHALRPERHTQGEHREYTAIGPFLDKLIRSAQTCSEELGYYLVVQEHRHLAWSFYQLTEERDGKGRRMTADKAAFMHCEDRIEQDHVAVALHGELAPGQLALLLAHETGHEKVWDQWESCLKSLEDAAYKTLILIDERR